MKRILSILILISASVSALAEAVSFEAAEKTAKEHFRSGSVSMVNLTKRTPGLNYASGHPEMFAFNNEGGGWIIVSGDDVSAPVLAYSDTGTLDAANMPEGMRAWIDVVGSRIRAARLGSPARKYTAPKGAGSEKLLQTASWGQEAPFNNLCPYDGTHRSVTGCVATALAIVLRYNKYPAHGTGTLDGYSYYSESTEKTEFIQGFSIENHVYDWDLMPLTYTSSSSSESKAAVAQLMYDLGVMMQMNYTYEYGSGAFSEDMIPALVNHMGYSNKARYLSHSSYTHDQWLEMIISEIDNDRPVLYDGICSDGGHQFVCDGYDRSGNLHINWGWDGGGNGYFSISYLGNSSTGMYTGYDSIVIGLEPANSDDKELPPYIRFFGSNGGISCSADIQKGKSFNVTANEFYNVGQDKYTGDLKICLVDRNDNIKELISEPVTISAGPQEGYDSYTFNCTVTSDIKPDDGIMMAYEWKDGWYTVGAYADYESENYPSSPYQALAMHRAGVLDCPVIILRDDIAAGENLYFNIKPGREHIKSVTWYFDGRKVSEGYVKATSGTHTVKAEVSYSNSAFSDTLTTEINVK